MEIIIAPPDVLTRYLAAFSRFFREGEKLCAAKDHAGILLTGYAANALHNVPDHLRHYDQNWTDSWFPVDSEWAEHFRAKGAPYYLINAWEEIFTPANDGAELGLDAKLSEWDVAPPAVFSEFMELFQNACLSIRFLRNLSTKPLEWHLVDGSRIKVYERTIITSTQIVRALSPLPAALVHWSSFDLETFMNNAEMLESVLLRDWWLQSMDKVREAVSAAPIAGAE